MKQLLRLGVKKPNGEKNEMAYGRQMSEQEENPDSGGAQPILKLF